MDVYELVRGPLAFWAFFLFFVGIGCRLFNLFRTGTNPKPLYPKEMAANGLKSMVLGITPFATNHMRRQLMVTTVMVIFHVSIIVLPLFLTAHIVLWFESYGIYWPGIPNSIADVMTLLVITGCLFFIVRRLTVTKVRQVSQLMDYLIPIHVGLIFLTGFLAFHQLGPYRLLLISHILFSEILLVMIPFTRLAHMILYPFSRYYLGSDFGKVLTTSDW